MRIFGSDRIANILKTMGMPDGQAVVHPWISKAIAKAQQKVESYHFDVRKQLLDEDGVMNDQRKVIYEQRRELMAMDDVEDVIKGMREDCVQNLVYGIAPDKTGPDDWDAKALHDGALELLGVDAPFSSWVAEPGMTPEKMIERLCQMGADRVAENMGILPDEERRLLKKKILIHSIDLCWKEHLQMLDFLKTSVRLRFYAQQNPLNAYKQEAFKLFEGLLARVRERVVRILAHNRFAIEPAPAQPARPAAPTDEEKIVPPASRNALCPCGSGKKYKHCHGKIG